MATLSINGQNVQVDDSFLQLPHDQQSATVDEIASSLKAAPSNVGIGEDLAKVAAAGPGRIVGGIAGLPGDLLHAGMRALGDNLSPESNYGSDAIMKSLGSDYQAQREPGRLAQKGLDFAPALIGGPETLGAKLLTRVAAPAVASEVGGAVGGPLGELGGALAGSVGATAAARKFQEMAAARTGLRALPTGEDLVKMGSGQFDQARDMDLTVRPDFAKRTAQDMRVAVENYDPEQIKPVLNAINRVEDLYQPAKPNLYNTLNTDKAAVPVPMNEVELARKQLSSLRTSPDATLRTAAKTAQEVITKNQMGLTAADSVSGDAPLYAKTMRDAVSNYGAGKRSNIITGKIDLADLNAGTAGSGANIDNNLRQAFKQLARPINNTNVPVARKLGFIDPEIAAIKQAATGTAVGNTARYLGKYAPTGIVSAAGGAGLGHLIGGPVGAAIPAVGYIAKKIGDLSTKRAVSAIDSLVRSRSPLAAHVAAQLPPQIIQQLPAKTTRLLRTLVLADPTLSQASQPVGQSNTN